MNEPDSNAPEPDAQPPSDPPPNLPPAAAVVLNGDRTEETERLRRELETERAARKKAETEAAYAKDELHRVTSPVTVPITAAPKAKKICSPMFSWGRRDETPD